jgi:hypothetical protein
MSAIPNKPIRDILQTLLALLSQTKSAFDFKCIAAIVHNINGIKCVITINRRNTTRCGVTVYRFG